jgi:hypothetical protein
MLIWATLLAFSSPSPFASNDDVPPDVVNIVEIYHETCFRHTGDDERLINAVRNSHTPFSLDREKSNSAGDQWVHQQTRIILSRSNSFPVPLCAIYSRLDENISERTISYFEKALGLKTEEVDRTFTITGQRVWRIPLEDDRYLMVGIGTPRSPSDGNIGLTAMIFRNHSTVRSEERAK